MFSTDAIPKEVLERISIVPPPPKLDIQMPLDEFKKSLQTVFHVLHRVDLSLYAVLLDQLSSLIDHRPSPDILYRRAFLYFYGRKRELAVLDLEQICGIDSTDHFALYLLGCCFRSLKKPREAISTLTRAIEISNSSVAKYFVRRGLSYSDVKEYEHAMADFSAALEIRPQYPKAFNARGIVLGDLKQHEPAIKDFVKALEYRPDYFKSFLNRANVYADQKRIDEAILDYTAGIQLQPRFFKAYSNRGHLYHELDLWDQALADFQCALFIDPDYVNSLYNLGILYMDMSRLDDAKGCFAKAVEIDPTDADCWAYLADICFSQRNYAQSVEYFGVSLRHDPNRRTLYNRGLAAYYQGWYELAIEDIDEYYRMDPLGQPDDQLTEDMVLFVRAAAYLALGEAQLALQDFSKGATLDANGTSLRWHARKAACHHKLGNFDACLREMHKWCETWNLNDSISLVEDFVVGQKDDDDEIAQLVDAGQVEQEENED
eukprot:TRINITY_DN3775_c0_g1_i1.p1 TRINITY_DN3775_c0_g1~~TRINITY_DN3775_c0_g1_i1.p1  ORF type:complete len:489 (+),score=62.37 TRINITY_DN3775_c0_g1_i1:1745-3211(+)